MSEPATTPPLDPEELMHALVLHGHRLARAARAKSRPAVAQLLEQTPGGRHDLLALALAGMLAGTPALHANPAELVAWSQPGAPPPPSRVRYRDRATGRPPGRPRLPREHDTERGYRQHVHYGERACPGCLAAHSVESRPQVCREEFRRLLDAGVDAVTAADLTTLRRLLAACAARSSEVAA